MMKPDESTEQAYDDSTGRSLERWVADAYRQVGARRVEHDVELGGNQIDVYVELETPGRLLHRIAVEAKNWKSTVGIDIVNGFAAIVKLLRGSDLIDEGVIVSASGFSKQARSAARNYGIRLLEPADLKAMVVEVAPTGRDTNIAPAAPVETPTLQQAGRDAGGKPQTFVEAPSDQPKYDAFISYSHRDKEWVRDWLLPRLEKEGLSVCADFRDFEPGAPSVTEMERAVQQSRKTLLVLTPNYLASEWAEFESILAATLDPAARERRVIPLLLEQCELPLRIRSLTYLDFAGSDREFPLQRLLAAVRSHPPDDS
ncbi:MAG: TIR domain-containing protein [Anaerolineae bacterium]|nr:TIR domain-containing protein [Anaerolineae bacterium]